jgi:hypothetical protein
VAAFANSLIDELSVVGNSLVMPSLNSKIQELFGFDFSDMLEEISSVKNPASEKMPTTKKATTKRRTNGRVSRKDHGKRRAGKMTHAERKGV